MIAINVIELPSFNIFNMNKNYQHIKIIVTTFKNTDSNSLFLESNRFYEDKAFYIKELDLYLLTFTNKTKTQYKWFIFKMDFSSIEKESCIPQIKEECSNLQEQMELREQQMELREQQMELREQQMELKTIQLILHLNNIFIKINNIQLAMLNIE